MLLQERLVRRALRSVDPLLQLESKWSPFSGQYYAVTYDVGEWQPLTVVDWRSKNTSVPLSLSLVDKVRYQEGDIGSAIKGAIAHNKARKEQVREKRLLAEDEIAQEWQKTKPGTKISVDFTDAGLPEN